MRTDLVQSLTTTFEAHAQQTEGGVEYWLARDLQYLLGYTEWRNFAAVIDKARTSCEVAGHPPAIILLTSPKRSRCRRLPKGKSRT